MNQISESKEAPHPSLRNEVPHPGGPGVPNQRAADEPARDNDDKKISTGHTHNRQYQNGQPQASDQENGRENERFPLSEPRDHCGDDELKDLAQVLNTQQQAQGEGVRAKLQRDLREENALDNQRVDDRSDPFIDRNGQGASNDFFLVPNRSAVFSP